MKLIYIAGPYSARTSCERMANVQRARQIADQVNRRGAGRCLAVTPHFLSAGIEDSGDERFWLAGTLEVMRRCDAAVFADDWSRSRDAMVERQDAARRGQPVFAAADLVAARG